MKRILFVALLLSASLQAQNADSTAMLARRNEVRVDMLAIITPGRFNLTYERFLDKDWSVGITGGFSDSKKIDEDFDRGYRNNVPQYDVTPFVRYNLSKSQTSFYFAEVFASYNSGDFKETVRIVDGDQAYYINEKSTYSDLGVGAGLGYKLYIKQQVGIELLFAFGTNLFNKDKSPDTLSRVGLSVGYRF
jgi:hypothetical protein